MRVAKIARAKGIPVISFIAPSAWAWRKGRAKQVAKLVNKVAAIFPFEYEVYKKAGADTEFMGHPLVDIVQPHLPLAEAAAEGRQARRQTVGFAFAGQPAAGSSAPFADHAVGSKNHFAKQSRRGIHHAARRYDTESNAGDRN